MIPVIIIGAALAAAGLAGYLAREALLKALSGKRIAILGPRRAGKSHLIRFLSSGSVPEKYVSTGGTTTAKGRRIELEDLSLVLKDLADVPGEDFLAEWKRVQSNADFTLYLFRVDRVLAGDGPYVERLIRDLGHIEEWTRERPTPLLLVGTHADLDPAWDEEQPGLYVDRFHATTGVERMLARAGGTSRVTIVLGSMKDLPATEKLTYALLRVLTGSGA